MLKTIRAGMKGSLNTGELNNLRKMAGGGTIQDLADKSIPYASNLVNSFRKLPLPPNPILENTIAPSYVNYDADRAQIGQAARSSLLGIDYKVANPAVASAIKASTIGSTISGLNNIAQTEKNTNANITNQNNYLNSTILARNVERQNSYNQDLLSRSLKQQQLQGENLSNLADKYQMERRDNRLMELEADKNKILTEKYKDSGAFMRQLADEYLKEMQRLNGNRYGGLLRKQK